MKKTAIILCTLLALTACTKQWNNLVSEPVAKGEGFSPDSADGPQLYNMTFDNWTQEGANNVDVCYGKNATAAQKKVWGSANGTTAPLGFPTVVPEEDFLAVPGEGKKALKLQTQGIKVLFGLVEKLASGSIFNGSGGEIDLATMSAKIYWGIPFTHRPTSLSGYACYKPGIIDWVQDPYGSMEGQMDKGHLFVILADWDQPFEVNPPEKLFDPDTTPGVVGYGKIVFEKTMDGYEEFNVKIDYRNDNTPRYVAIVAASSAMGDYFTGSSSSVLYLDELQFNY